MTENHHLPMRRRCICGVRFDLTNCTWVMHTINHWRQTNQRHLITLTNLRSAMLCRRDPDVAAATGAEGGVGVSDLPVAESIESRLVTLPMGPHLTDESVQLIARAVAKACQSE